jgi:hypothetical protein
MRTPVALPPWMGVLMCSRCSKLDDMVARLKSLGNPSMDMHIDALVRVTVRDIELQKQKLHCDQSDTVLKPT